MVITFTIPPKIAYFCNNYSKKGQVDSYVIPTSCNFLFTFEWGLQASVFFVLTKYISAPPP